MTGLTDLVLIAALIIAGGAIVLGVCAAYLGIRWLRRQGWL